YINYQHKFNLIHMKYKTLSSLASALLLASSLAIVSCGSAETNTTDDDTTANSHDMQNMNAGASAEVTISSTYPDTAVSGNATFGTVNGKVKMVLNITAPSRANKAVAVHIHEHAGCGDMGKDAHGHW